MTTQNLSESIQLSLCYQGAANAVACDIINMEQFIHGRFVVIHTGSSDTDLVLSLYESDDVAGSNTAAITTAVPIYADTNFGTSSDTLVAQTADYDYTIDTGTYPAQCVTFEIDPAILSAGYPCIYLADSGGNASNTCTIFFEGTPRYAGGTLPTAIA